MESDDKKKCSRCGEMKFSHMDFYMTSGGKYASECKACRIKLNVAYAKTYQKKTYYRERYREYDKAYGQAYYAKHREKLKEYRRTLYHTRKVDPNFCRRKTEE